jgi:transposase
VAQVALLTMSDGELARADTLRDLDQDRLTIEAAQQLLGLSRRQIFRLLKAYRLKGSTGLISRKRGRPSNRKTRDEVRAAALAIVRERYADFGPTLAAEKLAEHHGIAASKERLRRWMLEDSEPTRPCRIVS